jgi:hypothetical protein
MRAMKSLALLLFAPLAVATHTGAHAGEVYIGGGFPGYLLGYAQPLNDRWTVRADVLGAGGQGDTVTEEGIRYRAKARFNRTGVFGDWFVSPGGSFRLSFGVTVNDQRLDLRSSGSGGSITIGDTTYITTGDDRFEARIKFASTTPYFGVGWGHHAGTGPRFVADLGAQIGRAKVRTRVTGPLASQVSQSDIDQETRELRDGIGKVRLLPQATVAFGYSF